MKNEEKMTIEEARIELANNVYAFKREFEKSVSQVLIGFKKTILKKWGVSKNER